jgi:hypothetical protein
MPARVFSPFDLDILAYICLIVKRVYLRHKAIIAKIISYSCLSPSGLGLLPDKLVVIAKALPKLISIIGIGVNSYGSLESLLMR